MRLTCEASFEHCGHSDPGLSGPGVLLILSVLLLPIYVHDAVFLWLPFLQTNTSSTPANSETVQ